MNSPVSVASRHELDDLFTIPEVAAYLKVHRNTAYQLVKTRRIKSIQLSARRTRVTRKALEAYVRSLEVQAAKPLINPNKLRLVGR